MAINLIDLVPGTWLSLRDGRAVVVVDNPQDGLWVFCRAGDDPAELTVCATDIAAVLPAGNERGEPAGARR